MCGGTSDAKEKTPEVIEVCHQIRPALEEKLGSPCATFEPKSFKSQVSNIHLTTIAGAWYFGRVLVPQRLINLSLYHEILLLQKFNDTGGKVLKPKKISLQPQKKMRPCMIVSDCV